MADGIHIAIINPSTVLKDAQVKAVLPALQKQVTRDFKKSWGIDASLTFVPKGRRAPAEAWQLIILNNSDQAGALGYHDLTRTGRPLGKVFAGTDLHYGLEWTVTASHELLEMLADPNINLCAFADSGNLYAYEVCDACEADQFGYEIDGVPVSDFVFPGWFEPLHVTKGEKFDYRGKIRKPFGLLPGGYIGVFKIREGSGWTQITAKGTRPTERAIIRTGSRRERRRRSKGNWTRSTR